MIILSVIIIGYNFWTTNLLYFKMDVLKTNTVGFFNRVYARFEQLEGFTLDTPFAFITDGERFIGKTVDEHYDVFPNVKTNVMIRHNVISGLGEGTHKPLNYATYKSGEFIKNLLGIEMVSASSEQIREIMETGEYKNMGVYPAQTSVKMINGVAVVNFIDGGK